MRAWRNASGCRAPEPSPWVRSIARREALRLAAERGCEPLPAETPAVWIDEPERLDAGLDVRRAVSSLSPAEQQTLALRYWGDLTNRQIAARTASPVGTIKVRLHRANTRLRELLAP